MSIFSDYELGYMDDFEYREECKRMNRQDRYEREEEEEDDEDVLVYCEYDGMRIAYYHIDYTTYPIECKDLNETGWYDENDDVMYPEPIAWMPLPEPYKAESEDKE